MSTYLWRAVNAEPLYLVEDGEPDGELVPAGSVVFGRQSGYLSRSGAADAGKRAGVPFDLVRSEPVTFLTRADRLRRDIARLRAELAEIDT